MGFIANIGYLEVFLTVKKFEFLELYLASIVSNAYKN